MSYHILADEIVVQIVKLLRPRDVENFAMVSRHTYNVSYNRLEEIRALRHNATIMAARFPQDHSLQTYGLLSRDAPTSGPGLYEDDDNDDSSNTAYLGHLDLNSDLYWLQPLSAAAVEDNGWPQGEPASKEHLDELVLSAKRVGVKIPQTFLTFMGSKELIEQMWLGGNTFELGPSLVKCNPGDDKDGGGYAIRFFCDQQDCGFWSLYLAPGGYQAVLHGDNVNCPECSGRYRGRYLDGNTGAANDNHPKPKLYEGIPVACERLDLSLCSPNFELWLALVYFAGCRSAARSPGGF